MVLGAASACIFAFVFAVGGPSIIAWLTTDQATRDAATQWLPWVIAAPLIGIWSFLLDGIFIGATQTASMRNSMLLSLAVFLATAFIAVPVWGNTGVWVAYFVLLIARCVTLGLAWPKVVAATSHDHRHQA